MASDREPVIGIDLGTTNSEVAIIDGGTPRIVGSGDDAILPSCVGLDESGGVIVGPRSAQPAGGRPGAHRAVHQASDGLRHPRADGAGSVPSPGGLRVHPEGRSGSGRPPPWDGRSARR